MPGLGDTSECPVYHLSPAATGFVRLHGAYKRGILPEPGGMLDQPAVLMALFEEYDGLS